MMMMMIMMMIMMVIFINHKYLVLSKISHLGLKITILMKKTKYKRKGKSAKITKYFYTVGRKRLQRTAN